MFPRNYCWAVAMAAAAVPDETSSASVSKTPHPRHPRLRTAWVTAMAVTALCRPVPAASA